MTPEAFSQALQQRGFSFNSSRGVWVGPFNIQVSGALSISTTAVSPERDTDNQYARAATIGQVDEQLRAKRGISRDPLVEAVDPYSSRFSPYVQIPTPGTSPPNPVYPAHQQNLPPNATRID